MIANILVIVGPTASGKSSLGLHLASKFSGEIISADSMQVYKGLDIGTAKPSPDEQLSVKHHLIDIMNIKEPLDVFRYVDLADLAVWEIQSRNNLPIIVGGSGMYIQGLLYGLDPLPADPNLRSSINKEFSGNSGFEKLQHIMKQKDPEDYQRWHEHHRKLLRAYEVFLLTGKSITELQKAWKTKPRYQAEVIYLNWEKSVLRQRISNRTSQMLKNGWIEETKAMLSHGLLSSPTAYQALGYKIISDYLNGKIDYQEMETKINTATWRLAKRQITWFDGKLPEAKKITMPVDYDEVLPDWDEPVKT